MRKSKEGRGGALFLSFDLGGVLRILSLELGVNRFLSRVKRKIKLIKLPKTAIKLPNMVFEFSTLGGDVPLFCHSIQGVL